MSLEFLKPFLDHRKTCYCVPCSWLMVIFFFFLLFPEFTLFDPIEWLFDPSKTSYGSPADPTVLTGILIAIFVAMLVTVLAYDYVFRKSFVSKALSSLLISVLLAACVFFFVVLMQGAVSFTVAYAQQMPNVDQSINEYMMRLAGTCAVAVIVAGLTFMMFGRALAASYV